MLEARKQAAWSVAALRAAYLRGLGLTVDMPGSLRRARATPYRKTPCRNAGLPSRYCLYLLSAAPSWAICFISPTMPRERLHGALLLLLRLNGSLLKEGVTGSQFGTVAGP